MQTFLPYADFKESASVLDMKRLGKQRVEAYQILRIVCGIDRYKSWRNHPAVSMWVGYHKALSLYLNTMIDEWEQRGYRNNMGKIHIGKYVIVVPPPINSSGFDRYTSTVAAPGDVTYPHWFGDNDFHAAHRSNLLRKNAVWYEKFGWTENNDLSYLWPKRSVRQ